MEKRSCPSHRDRQGRPDEEEFDYVPLSGNDQVENIETDDNQ